MEKPGRKSGRIQVKIFYSLLFIFFAGCINNNCEERQQTLVQVSTIDALMHGVYDGASTLQDLSDYGDFGIGTFNSLNGEMVLLNGIFYQVKSDGKIYKPDVSVNTPFATVTVFNPESKHEVSSYSYDDLKRVIDSLMYSNNLFYAIKLTGTFESIKTRSVPAQEKPYKPLIEVTANQPEFRAESLSGTLSGFYCPPYVTGINVPGYHLHFVSEDENFGGHVLEFKLKEGILHLDQINNFRLVLPNEGDFLDTNLKEDLSEDLKKVEGS